MKKKLLLLLSLVLCMVCMAGCEKKTTQDAAIDDEIKTTIINTLDYNFSEWAKADFTAMAESEEIDDGSKSQYKSWQDLKDKIGELRSQTEPALTVEEEEITAKLTGEFENGKVEFTMTFANTGSALSLTVNEIESIGKIMEKALLNTLMGMGTVFVVLIIIILVIGSFGFIGKSQAKKQAAKEAEKKENAVSAPAVMAPVMEEPENVMDDLELVAVITAAIMASLGEEAPAEGLVVRSIKKRNASKWKKA